MLKRPWTWSILSAKRTNHLGAHFMHVNKLSIKLLSPFEGVMLLLGYITRNALAENAYLKKIIFYIFLMAVKKMKQCKFDIKWQFVLIIKRHLSDRTCLRVKCACLLSVYSVHAVDWYQIKCARWICDTYKLEAFWLDW